MSRISDAKNGREDGGYTRLFGNAQLGALISQVHAVSIKAGNELEQLIQIHSNLITEPQLSDLFKGTLAPGTYLVPKKLLRSRVTSEITHEGKKVEPDFLLLLVKDAICLVIELKDGDAFDTKKAEGEVGSLKAYATALHAKLPFPWKVEWRVCMFNQADKSAIVKGFKNRIELGNALTGEEFCRLLGVSYKAILESRIADQAPNVAYFVARLLAIPAVRAEAEKVMSRT